MSPAEIQVKINVARREMEFWQGVLADKRCGNCEHYDFGMCTKYDAAPPEADKQPGCDEWVWEQIPF